ncbi:hypothetical protein [Spongiactinospora sp. TRM90649]|uniref:hypothetical protein n=1 Tax=Spongiactinospora sp. TRM90649 TaxID=3031114 RepID=UPI0023F80CB7|nr:hypothetical protein [Spongiactinospora sp. TRM90649]MDF5758621.1 hypothetical protein [Spongiactinospora sp. TRM90649]
MDIEEILAAYRPPERTLPLCLRSDLQAVWEQLERDFYAAEADPGDDVLPSGVSAHAAKIAAEMEQVRADMQASMTVFALRAVPRPRWHELVEQHRADTAEVDEDAFGAATVAACCVSPQMTVEQAGRLQATLTDGQWEELTTAVVRLNRTATAVPYSAAVAARAALAGA